MIRPAAPPPRRRLERLVGVAATQNKSCYKKSWDGAVANSQAVDFTLLPNRDVAGSQKNLQKDLQKGTIRQALSLLTSGNFSG